MSGEPALIQQIQQQLHQNELALSLNFGSILIANF